MCFMLTSADQFDEDADVQFPDLTPALTVTSTNTCFQDYGIP